ncbi:hypothetical protein G8O18_13995 [Enterobacter kobei]|uniref:hypothetical protein n=1 Tax=Enterobacter kobei TaxID=208224 RepID=UPI002F2CB02B
MADIIFADNTSQEMRDEVLRLAAKWRPKTKKLVQGHGINDADYMTQAPTIYGKWFCPIYGLWGNMLYRVYSLEFHKKRPTYKRTQVHPDWFSFMSFRKWCLDNGWQSGYELDKDFISDSKIYGADTCAFIPATVNSFITDRGALRGVYPLGVNKFKNKFMCQCRNPFTKEGEYLGLFNTPEDAHNAWKQRKHQHALALADMYPDLDPRVLNALRTKYL